MAGLAIRQMQLCVQAPSEAAAMRLSRDAVRVARDLLPHRLAETLSLSEDGPADAGPVILIRRLELNLIVGADTDGADLAAQLARAIAAGTMRGLADQRIAVHFDNAASHAAAFITALASGGASDHWWFRAFCGVRALPLSAAIRTVLLRDPAQTLAILAAIPAAQRSRTLGALTSIDARQVADAADAARPGAPSAETWDLLARLAVAEAAPADDCRALALAAAALAEGAPESGLVTAARLVASLADWCTGLPTAQVDAMLHGASDGSLPPRTVIALASAPARRAMAAARAGADKTQPAAAPRWRYTKLGGFALLLPALFDLDMALTGWPAPAHGTPDGLIRLLTLCAAAGQQGALRLDPLWRDLFAIPAGFSDSDLRDWARSVGRHRWASLATGPVHRALLLPARLLPSRNARAALAILSGACLGDVARRLAGFADASPAFLRENLLGRGADMLFGDDGIRIRLDRPPLDVLLSISGSADRTIRLPDGRTLTLERAS